MEIVIQHDNIDKLFSDIELEDGWNNVDIDLDLDIGILIGKIDIFADIETKIIPSPDSFLIPSFTEEKISIYKIEQDIMLWDKSAENCLKCDLYEESII